jgi:hypothetical protein
VAKSYAELLQDLDEASIALRYCVDPAERPALVAAKQAAEDAIVEYDRAEGISYCKDSGE